jgi:geranylgeranyl pyrophosphate synthase
MIDDHNDYFGNPSESGKSIGQDFASGVPTLPLILGLQSPEIESEVRHLFCETARAPDDFRRMHQLLTRADVLGASNAFISDMARKARIYRKFDTAEDKLHLWFETLQRVLVTHASAS